MLRSALLIFSGNGVNAAMVLVRTILIARLVSVEDFGIAATLVMGMALVEMLTTVGVHQLLIQNKDGEDPELQAGLQAFHVIRSFVAALLLLLIAAPFARFMGIPEATGSFRLLALCQVILAFVHFDYQRMSRSMRYGPMAIIFALPNILSVVSILPFYWLFGDYRVMVFCMMTGFTVTAVASHILADRPYRLRFDPGIFRRCIDFGLPIMATGVLTYAVFYGERMIVGRALGMETLAVFSLAFSLTQAPALLVERSMLPLFLPQLGAVQSEKDRFQSVADAVLKVHLLGAGVLVAVFVVFAPLVTLFFGEKYGEITPLLLGLSVVQGLRLVRYGISVVCLGKADSVNGMLSSLARISVLPLTWLVAVTSGDLRAIIWLAVFAEGFGIAVGAVAMWRRSGVAASGLLRPAISALPLIALALVGAVAGIALPGVPDGLDAALLAVPALLLVVAATGSSLAVVRSLRGHNTG